MSEIRKLTAKDCERMNLPEEFWRAKISGVAESVRGFVTAYCSKIEQAISKPAGLLISGDVGVGKTGISSIALKAARTHGSTGYFITIWELRECIKAKIPFDADQSVLERCKSVGMLVLDDWASEDLKDYTFGLKHLTDLVMHRSGNKKPTIITTQMDSCKLLELEDFMPKVQASMILLQVEGENLRESAQQRLIADLMGETE